jgi:glutathione peroxidase
VALAAAMFLAACGDATTDPSYGGKRSSSDSGAMSDGDTDSPGGVLQGSLNRLNGEPEDLAAYQGKVVLVVNTATECGFTPQFDGLEKLYEQKKDEGLVILGFPADDVAHQEPRDDEEIASFCKANFGVSFPMFEKSNVKDDPVNPLFEKLDAALGEPTWNFNKYLVDRQGNPVKRFDVQVEPDSPELTGAIDELL